ncbi:MAG: 1,3-beta-galactosyl-N-acetylhexosamine phosphorylase [Clostridiales bacterium]|jgi:beta-D-galactosyl-(1->4)-L-rhamnose phosphorylase|nr:1,3-beta-galactosyl-N-acetylhexosamine phosphorylase [Clostridiales bacterium]
MSSGNFTLPGEAGYEKLTMELARRWGADVIRDSDGTRLSDEILNSGYTIYSTVCPVREHNEWIKAHPFARQQVFLSSRPAAATGDELVIQPMDGFFKEQFEINDTPDAMRFWQVYDRTEGLPLLSEDWRYNPKTACVVIRSKPWRQYSVSFLAWRVWEEISMYNHITNNWDKERLMQLNPYDPEALAYLQSWMQLWCGSHPRTGVVRFTSLFYNFAWIWGSDARNRNLFSDWASYDFTVSPAALDDFEREYGYPLCAEDFVRQGKYCAAHRLPGKKKLDWMDFIGRFVRRAAASLVDIVHRAGKLAYVFYDDSWIGMEPYNGHFEEFGFDGLIKCVFSGFEARLCAGAPVKTHEIRFHPYLFPVGLGGLPTFSPGGKPGRDAMIYWVNVRRALLRAKIERCGLGGYLNLTREFEDFNKAMDIILEQFRTIRELHDFGQPVKLGPRVAVLHAWGSLRTWTLSGHFHETERHILIHILESLSGLPFDVSFISFDDIDKSIPGDIDVIINAGMAGDAWSGGERWREPRIIENLTAWVHSGGAFIGAGEPSALDGGHTFLRAAHLLGVDIDDGERACHGNWAYETEPFPGLFPDCFELPSKENVCLIDGGTHVLAEVGGRPALTSKAFGEGRGVYLTGFRHGPGSARFLLNLILFASGRGLAPEGVSNNPDVECAVFPGHIVFINNSGEPRQASCRWNNREYAAELAAYGLIKEDL